jgi:acetyl esterase
MQFLEARILPLLLAFTLPFCHDMRGKETDTTLNPTRVIPYKQIGETTLSVHVFNPPGHLPGNSTPAIVFFFGGGWVGGTPRQFFPQSAYLASRGMVAICAEYRTKSQHQTTPDQCVEDGKSAMRWVRHRAPQLGINPHMIAAGGGSAGGHVAASTGTLKAFNASTDPDLSCVPQALVLFNPVYDNGPRGYGHERVKDYWKSFSPMHNLSASTPPAIVFMGTQDKLIPVETAKLFQARMQQHGIRSDLHLYQGQGHGFFNTARFHETLHAADRFLVSLGFLDGSPSIAPTTEPSVLNAESDDSP